MSIRAFIVLLGRARCLGAAPAVSSSLDTLWLARAGGPKARCCSRSLGEGDPRFEAGSTCASDRKHVIPITPQRSGRGAFAEVHAPGCSALRHLISVALLRTGLPGFHSLGQGSHGSAVRARGAFLQRQEDAMNSQDKLRPREMAVACALVAFLTASLIWGEQWARWMGGMI